MIRTAPHSTQFVLNTALNKVRKEHNQTDELRLDANGIMELISIAFYLVEGLLTAGPNTVLKLKGREQTIGE